MKRPFPVALIILLLFSVSIGSAVAATLREPVRIETGLIIGAASEAGDVVAFKGIPFAAPPVGELRWCEPQPPVKWEGVRPATAFGASCVQPLNTRKPPYTAEFSVTTATSEDCLFLNVWTPAKSADEKLGVLVYIHGGSGTHGSGSVSIYDGEELARKGIVVVTFNFRLGILAGMGHPELTAESPHKVCGNYGELDKIAALKWVRDNIAVFGGDPAKVTLAGQSSGSVAMHYLTTSPLAKGLFRGAIGASFSYDYLRKKHAIGNVWQKEQQGLKFATAKNVKSLAELRKIPADELIAIDPAVEPFTRSALGGGVNTDGWAYPRAYPEALDKGLENDVPTMTGMTADDYGSPVQYMNTTVASFAETVPRMFGEKKDAFLAVKDVFFAFSPVTTDSEARALAKQTQIEYRMASIFAWAERRAKTAKTPVYTYFFDQPIPWPEHPEFGAFHSSDLIYAFNNLKQMDRPWTAVDRRVADLVSSYWVNFVKTGNPNGAGLPEWRAFDPQQAATMALGAKPGPRAIASKERFEFYRRLHE